MSDTNFDDLPALPHPDEKDSRDDRIAALEQSLASERMVRAVMEVALGRIHLLADSGATWHHRTPDEIRAELRAMVREALARRAEGDTRQTKGGET